MAQGTREKKIIALASEFAEALTSGNYKEAYNRAGALNAEVKAGKSEVLQWFGLPFYFGKLTKIGLSGSYDEQIEIVESEGSAYIGTGSFTVEDLEQLNRQAEEY